MKTITQRELRNQSGEIMRAVDRGESFIVTRNGVPVAELRPIQRRRFIDTKTAMEELKRLPKIDWRKMREELDAIVDPYYEPRT